MKFPLPKLNDFFDTKDIFEGIVSLWGDYGVGKTTLLLQTAYSNAYKHNKVLYLYTKPNLPYNKISVIIENDLEKVLENIIFFKSTDFEDLFDFVFNLEFILLDDLKADGGTFRLIIIDSITDLYRLELGRDKKGKNFILNYKLNQILANLMYLNKKYEINILIANELSRRTLEGITYDVVSGGNVMEYWVKRSIKIERTEVANNRKFFVTLSDNKDFLTFNSMLTESGFK